MSAFLPQSESAVSAAVRRAGVDGKRIKYRYNYTHVSPLAIAEWVPIEDGFSLAWLHVMAGRINDVLNNREALEQAGIGHKESQASQAQLQTALQGGEAATPQLKDIVAKALRFGKRPGVPATPAKSLQDYADLFRKIGLPPIAKEFREDRSFALMRVAGPNPVMLQQIKQLDERLPLTDAEFQVGSPDDTLDAALAEGRLYVADYAVLDGAEMGNYPNGQKYLYAPVALFALDPKTRALRPVAIRCRQEPAANNPIFTPDDGYNWLIAKTIVEVADGNVHEASTHLGRTHLTMEPFAIATYRNLAVNHPLHLLLAPHFQGTLAINNASWTHLIADQGGVDKLFGGTIGASRAVVVNGVQSINVMNDRLPLTFERRGTADRTAFPDYPYRDDALLYWNAIHQWANAYLRVYYQSDKDVQRDHEARAWVRELAAHDGGRMKGLPNDGVLERVDELVEITTFVIHTCSVQHAAVNFPQYDHMSYVPNMPLASYRPAPTSKRGATEADFVAMLPTLDMAELQMDLGYLLGTVHYTELGQYAHNQFLDPRVVPALAQFQFRLRQIGREIEERNQTRRPYTTLAPKGIPQSINI